ncbi:S-layer homology domain-containing protein [Alteribacillus sp. JSM 102045]|uniref:S-layer homology domain-containing protein n=1 Tax=Alteribacillus sp. JSM 102045 TaxID=1562101 RepID=UPI0035C0DB1B
MKKSALPFFLLLFIIALPLSLEAKTSFKDLESSFWAAEEIQFIADQGVAAGYKDNTFRPKANVSRAQTAKMISNALDLDADSQSDQEFNDVDESHAAYPYIAAVAEEGIMNGSDGNFRPNETLSRAQMAVVLSQAFDLNEKEDISFSDVSEDYWAFSSIQRLAANRITSGLSDGSFGPGENTTRAQFSVFLARAMEEEYRVEEVNLPPSGVDSEEEAWHFRGVTIGDSADKLASTLGEPEETEKSRYGFEWRLYHDDYDNYVQYGVENGEVVAVYSNQDTWRDESGLQLDDSNSDVIDGYGDPLQYIQKGGSNFSLETEESGTYKENGRYTTFFYDKHRDNRITAVLLVDSEVEENFNQYYAEPTKSLKESYEHQVFHIANAQRKRYGRSILEWDDMASGTARAHSADMVRNQFFDHTNLDGENPFDRMRKDGIKFYNAAENIAYGQVSPIFAHEGWMNSKSHRDSLLGNYKRLGVGVAFNESRKQPYYTQNFFTPR